jgi:hypothetical protein
MKTAFAMLLASTLLAGCVSGRLYHNVVEPYSWSFHDIPVGSKRCVLNAHRVKEPVTQYGINAEWDTDSIMTQAREAGISRIYYADLHTFSIFFDLYTRKEIIIYGD